MTARRSLFLASFLLASASAVACGPSSGSHGDPTSPTDTTYHVQPVSSSACAETLDDYCKGTDCLKTWTTADSACMNAPVQYTEPAADPLEYSTACGSYFALSQAGTTAYYDASTQALVAVVDLGGKCSAGPAGFVPPAVESCSLVPCGPANCGVPDAGVDGM
jgi:hypothetical protein